MKYVLMKFTVRILKSGLLSKSDVEPYFDAIITAQKVVDRCFDMVEIQNKLARQDYYC